MHSMGSCLHADSEDSDQTGQMSRKILVFAGRTLILLVLSCHGSVLNAKNFVLVTYKIAVKMDLTVIFHVFHN